MNLSFAGQSGPALVAIAAFAVTAVLAGVVAAIALLRAERGRGETAAHLARVAEMTERLQASQARLVGRLEQAHGGMNQRLEALSRRLGDSLFEQGERTGQTLRAVNERLAVIDTAQRRIAELSGQVLRVHDLLGDKQARGAFGEIQLHDLVIGVLPPGAFAFQVTLGNGCRADCLLKLPDPPGPIAVDAKFPLESFRALREPKQPADAARAARSFAADILRHIRDIEARYIVPGETADAAMMFLPSESVYAELHANFRETVEESFRRKVWIVSPTTLWATLSTLRAVLRDVRLREQAGVIQAELRALGEDAARLDAHAAKLQRHFDQACEDVRQLRLLSGKTATRAGRIDVLQVGEAEGDMPDDPPAAPSAPRGGPDDPPQ